MDAGDGCLENDASVPLVPPQTHGQPAVLMFIEAFPEEVRPVFGELPVSLWPQHMPRGKYSYSVITEERIPLQVLLRQRQLMLEFDATKKRVRRTFSFGKRSEKSAVSAFMDLRRCFYASQAASRCLV